MVFVGRRDPPGHLEIKLETGHLGVEPTAAAEAKMGVVGHCHRPLLFKARLLGPRKVCQCEHVVHLFGKDGALGGLFDATVPQLKSLTI